MGGADAIAGHVISVGAAFAGLVLVFLGINVASFDSYGAEQQKHVRGRFKARLGIAFLGFFLSVVAVGLGFAADWSESQTLAMWSAGVLALAVVLTVLAAGMVVSDVFD